MLQDELNYYTSVQNETFQTHSDRPAIEHLHPYLSEHRNEIPIQAHPVKLPTFNKRPSILEAYLSALSKDGVLMAAGSAPEFESQIELNLFHAVFGRDALISALLIKQASEFYYKNQYRQLLFASTRFIRHDAELSQFWENVDAGKLLGQTIKHLACYQGVQLNLKSESEPGKIPHEIRNQDEDPIAKALHEERGWEFPYFGSIDATMWWVKAVCEMCVQDETFLDQEIVNQFNGETYSILDCLQSACNYILELIDTQGRLTYRRLNPKGIEIQSWRDSYDAISSIKGDLPNFHYKLELFDLSVLALDTLNDLKVLMHRYKNDFENSKNRISMFEIQYGIDCLTNRLWSEYWVSTPEGRGYFAMGLQDGQNGKVIFDSIASSNLTWLHSSLFAHPTDALLDKVRKKRREDIIISVYPQLCNNPFGVATLSDRSNRYHPCGYHTGNIWLFDSAMCVISMLKIGRKDLAREIAHRVISTVEENNCYPELVGLYGQNQLQIDVWDEHDKQPNRICQPGQPLQTWTLAGYILLRCIDFNG